MQIRHATRRDDIITGMWKFSSEASPQMLATIAREWKDTAPDRYEDIHIRSWGRDQFAICFTYVRPLSYPMRVYIKIIKEAIKTTLKCYGTGRLVGWDITEGAWVVE